MENKDKISIWISLTALAVACISLFFTYLSHRSDVTENLLIRMSVHHQGYATEVQQGYGDAYPALIPTKWNCLIVNNGKNPTTIIKSHTKQVSPDFPVYHSRISSGFMNDKEEPINFPITLQPGEAINIVYFTTILLTPDIYELIKDKYPVGTKVYSRRLKSHLFSKGVDFYGNSVKQTIYPGGGKTIEYSPDIVQSRQQIFVLNIETAKGNEISTVFSQYRSFD
jgi:hypothetical protein